jgi:selenocysteine-specific elongation factor
MHVIATAGHVDHGKSTLVRALTGMEPDRWAEERRRGMTIDLGFAWTGLPSGATLAFVDVPGHERFVPNMLAGVGAVPAALIVVAADDGWMPQSAEHLAALDALGVRHGLIAVTRSDLADPAAAAELARAEVAATSLGDVEVVAVSGATGDGLPRLFGALDRLVAALPPPDREAPVRLWIDRAFTIRGSGTVVTGTLGAGRLRAGDELVTSDGRAVRVRGLQSLGESVPEAGAVARVALNLRGVEPAEVGRGTALLTPGEFGTVGVVDVRVTGDEVAELPRTATLHVGSAAVTAHIRPIGKDTARLRLERALPLRLGDRALLRDPGQRRLAGGVTVLDVAPAPLRRRGASAARAVVLAGMDGRPDERDEVRRRLLVRRVDLRQMGVTGDLPPVTGDWLADPAHWEALRSRLESEVARYARERPLEPGMPVEELRRALSLPDRALVETLIRPPLVSRGGRVRTGDGGGLPEAVARAVDQVLADLARAPFAAPEAARLAELGLGPRQIAAATRAGALLRLGESVVLAPGAVESAAAVLATLPQPFTLSDARRALGTTRRVAVPLLETLDRAGHTRRQDDDRRVVNGPAQELSAEV